MWASHATPCSEPGHSCCTLCCLTIQVTFQEFLRDFLVRVFCRVRSSVNRTGTKKYKPQPTKNTPRDEQTFYLLDYSALKHEVVFFVFDFVLSFPLVIFDYLTLKVHCKTKETALLAEFIIRLELEGMSESSSSYTIDMRLTCCIDNCTYRDPTSSGISVCFIDLTKVYDSVDRTPLQRVRARFCVP